MKLNDLRKGGHAPSLLSAFLHFDISFMVWVILGALMPFIITDATLTGKNLLVTPSPAVRSGQYTVVIKGPDAKLGQKPSQYSLLIKPGPPAIATRASVKPVEKFVLDNGDLTTIEAANAKSRLVFLSVASAHVGSPNESVVPLQSAASLASIGAPAQPIANGYPASVKLTLIAVPLLAAGFWRILLGALVDQFNSKRVGMFSLAFTLLPLLIAWRYAGTYNALLFVGFFLGLAGASFAVALPLASRWYPPHLQGVAMGIAGAGNSGTVMATIFAPMLAKSYGWHAVFGLLAIPVIITLLVFTILAKDPPAELKPFSLAKYAGVLRMSDAWAFCALYFVTFGGFVGLSSFVNTFFVDQYDAPRAAVGLWTWPFIIAGSFLRPVGGALSDKLGGIRMLAALLCVAIASAIGISMEITNVAITSAFLFLLMGCLGMGNGAVFQLVPQRFKNEIGALTGLVGAAGGVGGYYLNFALGHLHDATGTYASGFLAFAGIGGVALVLLKVVSPRWTASWLASGGRAHTAEQVHTSGPPVPAMAHSE